LVIAAAWEEPRRNDFPTALPEPNGTPARRILYYSALDASVAFMRDGLPLRHEALRAARPREVTGTPGANRQRPPAEAEELFYAKSSWWRESNQTASGNPGAVQPHRRRRTIYRSIDELRADLDAWIAGYNEQRPHQGRWLRQDAHTDVLDAVPMAREKMIAV
jgi:hypothetical protein